LSGALVVVAMDKKSVASATHGRWPRVRFNQGKPL